MQLRLATLPLLVDGVVLLGTELAAELLDSRFVVLCHPLALDPQVAEVLVLQLPDLILVPLHDSLDFWLQAFDGLGSDLVNLFLLPLFLPHLLSCDPSVPVLPEFYG